MTLSSRFILHLILFLPWQHIFSNLTISDQLKHISKCAKFFLNTGNTYFSSLNTDFCVNAIILYHVTSEIFI